MLALLSFSLLLANAQPPGLSTAPTPQTSVASDHEVTLDEIVAYALAHAPRIAALDARRKLAAATRAGADATFPSNPTLSMSLGPRIGSDVGIDAEVSVSQELEVFGEQDLRLVAANARVRSVEADLDVARADMLGEVTRSYHRLLVARGRAALARRALSSAEETLKVAKARQNAGNGSALATSAAESSAAAGREALMGAESRALEEESALDELTGWPADAALKTGAVAAHVDVPDAALVECAHAKSPKLQVLARGLEAARAKRALVDGTAMPKPIVGASIGTEGALRPSGADALLRATVAVPLPLWQTNQREKAEAASEVAQLEAELALEDRALRARTLLALARYHHGVERAEILEREVIPRGEENVVLLNRAFALGEVDALQVISARRELLGFEERSVDAKSDALAALDDLFHAVGVGALAGACGKPSAP